MPSLHLLCFKICLSPAAPDGTSFQARTKYKLGVPPPGMCEEPDETAIINEHPSRVSGGDIIFMKNGPLVTLRLQVLRPQARATAIGYSECQESPCSDRSSPAHPRQEVR